MTLSPLQRYILREAYTWRGPKLPRRTLLKYYDRVKRRPSADDMQNSMTKSLERLIDRGMLIGYGHRTPVKWFIEEVKLTPLGRASARRLLRDQPRLPL